MTANNAPVVIECIHDTLCIDRGRLLPIVDRVLEAHNCTVRYLGIVLANHETVLDLNRTYLEHDYLTDVLSFRLNELDPPEVIEGEVYVDLDTAAERHAEFNASFEEEVMRYVVHGLLHLIGYTDATEREKADMRAREDDFLSHLS